MRYRFIQAHRNEFRVWLMCRVLGVSRGGFYLWLKRPESQRSVENGRLVEAIRAIHRESRGVYGSPRVHARLRAQSGRYGRNRIARLMREMQIQGKRRRKFRVTTDSDHTLPISENILDRKFTIGMPNKAWVADITYIATKEGWLYLAGVLDLYSRRIVGWAMGSRISRHLVERALWMAICNRGPKPGLLHHSDRGCQYASHDYRKLLERRGIVCSMSRKGNCWDNAVMESFFGTLKTELVYHREYETREEARSDIFDYIEVFYNRQRLHSALGYRSPADFEKIAKAA
jgi:putative transposase